MKTFKLLCKYPSLPNDWKVGMEVGLGDRVYGYSPCAGNYTDCRKLENNEVEKHPEFWKEVIQKEYEILSFKCIVKNAPGLIFNEVRVISENTNLSVEAYLERDSSVKNGDWAINSIKRSSDGVVFTVGDKTTLGIMTCFRLLDNELMVDFDNKNSILLKSEQLQHVKQSLFTTTDGVEVFIGDNFYYVDKDFNTCLLVCSYKDICDFTEFNMFSTEIAAKKFIKENEKRYSLNDIRETIKKLDCFGSTIIAYLEKQ